MTKALLLLLVASPAFAEVKTKLYPSGALQERFDTTTGLLEEWADNCQIVERGHIKNGKRDGAWTTWSEDGAKENEGSYVVGIREGVWTFYGPKGEKQFAGPYVHGVANGTFTEWFAGGGKWRDYEMKDGKRVGPKIDVCEALGGQWRVDYEAQAEGCLVGGKETGEWTGYYPTGAVRWRNNFTQGYRDGHGEELHPTGELLHQGEWLGGIPEGSHRWQSPTGVPYGTSSVIQGTGEVHEFAPNGRHTADVSYVNGSAQGVWKSYYDNGALNEETTFVAAEKSGPYKRYYALGDLMITGAHLDGHRVGAWAEYWDNGKVKWSGSYDAGGQRIGLWTKFAYSGQVEATGTFAEDRENGAWMYFHDSGKLEATGMMVDGLRSGLWQTYFADGKPWRRVQYDLGNEVGAGPYACRKMAGDWVADPEKRMLGCQVCRARPDDSIEQIATGPWMWWHPNGQLEKQGTLDAGKQVGRWSFFFDNGKPMLAGDYADGHERGAWQGFYREGARRFEGAYEAGKPTGTWQSWYESGAPMSEGRYEAGKKVGAWTYYDRSGKPEHVTY